VQDPQIAIAVLIEHGGHGGDAAAPMAKKVFEKFVEQEKQKTEKQQVHLDGETRAD
jgi:penicillin-binding protein 2